MDGSPEELNRYESSQTIPLSQKRQVEEEWEECDQQNRERLTKEGYFVFKGKSPSDNWDVSLREWLDKSERTVDLLECHHIFRQVVDMVSSAHDQGIIVGNVRPSCFVMSSFNRVSFIESASCSTSGSNSDSSEDKSSHERFKRVDLEEDKSESHKDITGTRKEFPMKQILSMELKWYTSPEEASGCSCTLSSDIYKLGVLLFELFCECNSSEEKLREMSNLRHRVFPSQFLRKWPQEATFCLWLLHPLPSSRPKMSDVLKSDILNEPHNSFNDRENEIKLRDKIEHQELLLDFLLRLHQEKQGTAEKLCAVIQCLSSDISEVMKQRPNLEREKLYLEHDKQMQPPERNKNSKKSGLRKCVKQKHQMNSLEGETADLMDISRSDEQLMLKESTSLKSARFMKNIPKLEETYFKLRNQALQSPEKVQTGHMPESGICKESAVRTNGSSIDNFLHKHVQTGTQNKWISPFLDGMCKYLSFRKLKVRAHLKHGDFLNACNLVCSVGFDRDKELFATAGVNQKIKIFECDMILDNENDVHYPIVEMACRSRLSSISWNSYIKSQIASSDFDGVVQVWDVVKNQVSVEMKEHTKRVWSVDYSSSDPTKLASGSDDCCVKLWNINQVGSIGTIKTNANVCSVQFPPNSTHSLAIGSADHRSYYYDLRNVRVPIYTLVGHTKTVSYVKYMDSSTLISASTDNSLKLWDMSKGGTSGVIDNPLQTFTGHTNTKNFVGLSVSDGYIATGSETNEVFVYHKAFPMPMLSFKFNNSDHLSVEGDNYNSQFISCVCWRDRSSILVAANSSGSVKLLEMV